MRVLVVEDNVHVRQTIIDVLSIMDHDVLAAGSGEEALAQLQGSGAAPDLLISDVSLPGIDGVSLLRFVQRHYPRCRAIITSGLPREQHDIDDVTFLQKPFTLDQLLTYVDADAPYQPAAV